MSAENTSHRSAKTAVLPQPWLAPPSLPAHSGASVRLKAPGGGEENFTHQVLYFKDRVSAARVFILRTESPGFSSQHHLNQG